MREPRKCAGKPDGSPCGALAVRGEVYCRHHRGPQMVPLPPAGPAELVLRLSVDDLREPMPEDPEVDAAYAAYLAAGNPAVERTLGEIYAGVPPPPGSSGKQMPAKCAYTSLQEQHFLRELRRQGIDEAVLKAVPPGDIDRRLRQLLVGRIEWFRQQLQEQGEVYIRVQVIPSDAVGPDGELPPHPVQLDGLAQAPNRQVDRDLNRALVQKEDWRTNTDEGSVYFDSGTAVVMYRPPEVFPDQWFVREHVREATLKALDKRFSQMHGDLVTDIIDALFYHWLANGQPAKARITLSQICEYRGVKPERKTLETHWKAVRDARSIRLRGGPIEDIALLEIDAIRAPQLNLFGNDTPPAADLVCVYSPGWFVAQAVGPRYLAHYTQALLRLDPYRFNTAKRIARYLRGDWRLNPGRYLPEGPRRYRTWREHLADAGVEVSDRYRRQPNEFLDQLDDQLLELARIEALRDWTANLHRPDRLKQPLETAEWEKAADLYHPEDRGRLRTLPRHGRLEAFLSLRVHLPPAATHDETMRYFAGKQRARAAALQARNEEVAIRKSLPPRGH